MNNIKEQFKEHIGEDVRLFYKKNGYVTGRIETCNDYFVTLKNARAIMFGKRYYFIVTSVPFNTIKDVYLLKEE